MSTGTETSQGRRRVQLTPMRSIPVEFTGERAGEGPLTLAQLNIYTWLIEASDHFYGTLCVELPVPAVVSVDGVAEAVAVPIARHECLRTTYLPGEQPRQRVAASGVQLLEIFSLGVGQWGPQDRPAVAGALIRWLPLHGRSRPPPHRHHPAPLRHLPRRATRPRRAGRLAPAPHRPHRPLRPPSSHTAKRRSADGR